ncbi:MAG: Flp family type IVb pilin [Sphingobium sp.]
MFGGRIVTRVFKDNKGATAIEYGLIATFIAIAAIAALTNLGSQVAKPFNNVSAKL